MNSAAAAERFRFTLSPNPIIEESAGTDAPGSKLIGIRISR